MFHHRLFLVFIIASLYFIVLFNVLPGSDSGSGERNHFTRFLKGNGNKKKKTNSAKNRQPGRSPVTRPTKGPANHPTPVPVNPTPAPVVPTPAPTPAPGCFSGTSMATVRLPSGRIEKKPMDRLEVRDSVLTGSGSFQTIYGFSHRHRTVETGFVQIFVENSEVPLEATPDHLAFVMGQRTPIPVSQLKVGHRLYHTSIDGQKNPKAIIKIATVIRNDGVYSPLTSDGTIVVNDIVMSVYGGFQESKPFLTTGGIQVSSHTLSHLWFTPVRILCSGFSDSFCQYEMPESGLCLWSSFGENILAFGLTQHPLIQFLIFVTIILCIGLLALLEVLFKRTTLWVAGPFCFLTKRFWFAMLKNQQSRSGEIHRLLTSIFCAGKVFQSNPQKKTKNE